MKTTVQNEELLAFLRENRDREIKDIVFNSCDFTGLNLSRRVFADVDFDCCTFDATTFYNSYFVNTNFWGLPYETHFSGQTDFTEAIFDENSKTALGRVLEGYIEKILEEKSMASDFKEESLDAFLPIGIDQLFPSCCPHDCDFIGYKIVSVKDENGYDYGVIAKLLIPASATSVSGFSKRCRTTEAQVLEIMDEDGEKHIIATYNNRKATIHPGDILRPKRFCKNRFLVSKDDIDFALTFDDAFNYYRS